MLAAGAFHLEEQLQPLRDPGSGDLTASSVLAAVTCALPPLAAGGGAAAAAAAAVGAGVRAAVVGPVATLLLQALPLPAVWGPGAVWWGQLSGQLWALGGLPLRLLLPQATYLLCGLAALLCLVQAAAAATRRRCAGRRGPRGSSLPASALAACCLLPALVQVSDARSALVLGLGAAECAVAVALLHRMGTGCRTAVSGGTTAGSAEEEEREQEQRQEEEQKQQQEQQQEEEEHHVPAVASPPPATEQKEEEEQEPQQEQEPQLQEAAAAILTPAAPTPATSQAAALAAVLALVQSQLFYATGHLCEFAGLRYTAGEAQQSGLTELYWKMGKGPGALFCHRAPLRVCGGRRHTAGEGRSCGSRGGEGAGEWSVVRLTGSLWRSWMGWHPPSSPLLPHFATTTPPPHTP